MSSSSVSLDRLRKLRDALVEGLVERDLAIRMALIAAIAGEHLLLLGPPGTAKSLVSRRLHLAFKESAYFERLLTRFTVPEELFGPLSIKGLEADRYERLTDKYLPTASIAFLDEIFKANSAILNALLTLLNEREFDNGIHRVKTPLISVIGASNELPEAEELAALSDRFLIRLYVGPVSNDAFPQLLGLRGHAAPTLDESLKLSSEDILALQAESEKVTVPADIIDLLSKLRDRCTAENIRVSDRRWRKIVKLLQVSALSHGRDTVSIWDAWILQHCLWENPEDRQKLANWYAERVGANNTMNPEHLLEVVEAKEDELKKDKTEQRQARDEAGNLLYRAADGSTVIESAGRARKHRGKEPLWLAPAQSWQRATQLTDRTNGRTGYTQEEVGLLSYRQDWHGQYLWRHANEFAAYLAAPENFFYEDAKNVPVMEPMRFKESVIKTQLEEIAEIHQTISDYQNRLQAHLESLETEIRTHLWMLPDFAATATRHLNGTKATVAALLVRTETLKKGFDSLPRELPVAKKTPKAPLPSSHQDHPFTLQINSAMGHS